MATSILQVQVEDSLKAKASALYEELGLDLPTAVRIFLKRSVMQNGLPFDMRLPVEKKAVPGRERIIEDAITAMREIRAESERNGNAEMTLDEINAEINAVRAEHYTQKAAKVWASP